MSAKGMSSTLFQREISNKIRQDGYRMPNHKSKRAVPKFLAKVAPESFTFSIKWEDLLVRAVKLTQQKSNIMNEKQLNKHNGSMRRNHNNPSCEPYSATK